MKVEGEYCSVAGVGCARDNWDVGCSSTIVPMYLYHNVAQIEQYPEKPARECQGFPDSLRDRLRVQNNAVQSRLILDLDLVPTREARGSRTP